MPNIRPKRESGASATLGDVLVTHGMHRCSIFAAVLNRMLASVLARVKCFVCSKSARLEQRA
jgi:hypothetical protein